MKIKLPVISLLSLSVSTLAMAGVAQFSGETTCTAMISISEKTSVPTPCTYEADIGSSMTYSIHRIAFTMPNGYIVKLNNSSTFHYGDNGEAQDVKYAVTINGTDADVMLVDKKTLKIFNDDEANAMYANENTNYDKLLTCYKPKTQNDAFCYPFNLLDEYM